MYDMNFRAHGAQITEEKEIASLVTENALSQKIIGYAMQVHKALGPGLLESAYRTCLQYELLEAGIATESEKHMSLTYKEVRMQCGYRLDLLVAGKVIVELKAVEALNEVHVAQLLTYLKLSGCRLGLLINFHSKLLKDGIKRVIL